MDQDAQPVDSKIRLRAFEFDVAGRAADGRIPTVISTDAVVDMPEGPEVLLHTPAAVDLKRAPLPLIATHRGGQINVGVIEDIELSDGKMRGMTRFGSRPEARGYAEDVVNRVIRSVSVGYARLKGYQRNDGVTVVTRWMPFHAALVAEPADIDAGFFREADAIPDFEVTAEPDAAASASPRNRVSNPAQLAVKTQPAPAVNVKGSKMENETRAAGDIVVEDDLSRRSPVEVEKARKQSIRNLCQAYKLDDDARDHWIKNGCSIETVSEEILQLMEERGRDEPKSVAQLGLSNKEIRQFSIVNAIKACADGNWNAAGFEAECSRAIVQKTGRQADPKKFYIPYEIQQRGHQTPVELLAYSLMKRDLTVGTAGAGGYLVETTNVGFIEMLRNKSVLFNMGARRLSGLVGNVAIPKQSAAATAVWLANEGSTATESQQTFVQIAMSPKNVGGYTELSRQLLLQSSPSAEGLVMADLAQVVALDIDLKGLNGSGASGQPTGILNTAGIGSVTGTSMDYADIIEFQTDVFAGNALNANAGYVTTGVVAGLLKQRVKFSSTASPIWEGRLEDGVVDAPNGYRGMASNQMPAATMLFGDFGQVIVAEWGVLEVEVNPYANFQAGIVGVRALASIDIAVRHPTAFSAASSIT